MKRLDEANLIVYEDYLKKFILRYFRDAFNELLTRGQNVDELTINVLIHRLKSDIKESRHLLLKQTIDAYKMLDLNDVIFSQLNSDVKAMTIKEMDEDSKYRNNVIKLVNSLIEDLKINGK